VASLQDRNGSFKLTFYYLGRRHYLTLGKISRQEADATAGKVDLLLLRIEQKLLRVPSGVSIEDFLLNDGKPPEPEQIVAAASEPVTFKRFRERYIDTHRQGSMEQSSLATTDMHLGHFEKTLGPAFPLQSLTLPDLQRHVTTRAQKKYRGKPLSPVTLKKEMASFRAAWNWAALTGLVGGGFPSRGLVYPKGEEKSPFMTRVEIERRIAVGGLTGEQTNDLWESLYLRVEEIDELLAYVKERAALPWIYPFFCTAAFTGARRSELLRIQVADVDLDGDTILIREKKRSRKQRTTRHVSISPPLKAVLGDWLAQHPGGPVLFCQSGVVERSKKRSRTTGHQDEKVRPSSLKGRLATVRARGEQNVMGVTRDEAHDHFKRTLAGGKWEVLRGPHVLRHSFISCLAAAGVDQRIIDDFVGHQTDEQRRRYRHLLPDVKKKALSSVFAGPGAAPPARSAEAQLG
jgi:integrase